jgi:hypothetical protein
MEETKTNKRGRDGEIFQSSILLLRCAGSSGSRTNHSLIHWALINENMLASTLQLQPICRLHICRYFHFISSHLSYSPLLSLPPMSPYSSWPIRSGFWHMQASNVSSASIKSESHLPCTAADRLPFLPGSASNP